MLVAAALALPLAVSEDEELEEEEKEEDDAKLEVRAEVGTEAPDAAATKDDDDNCPGINIVLYCFFALCISSFRNTCVKACDNLCFPMMASLANRP